MSEPPAAPPSPDGVAASDAGGAAGGAVSAAGDAGVGVGGAAGAAGAGGAAGDGGAAGAGGPPRLSTTVVALGAVSLLTDASSEMIYPLLPLLLTGALGAGLGAVGVIEGAAEAVAALLKLVSGRLSDRMARRKPLVLAGYGLSALLRPLLGLAPGPLTILAIRLGDRLGKGLRSGPRDALLADATAPPLRGRAFGLHRAMDNAGAVIGPLLAYLLLGAGLTLRGVFLCAAVPGALAVLCLVMLVRERPRASAAPAATASPAAPATTAATAQAAAAQAATAQAAAAQAAAAQAAATPAAAARAAAAQAAAAPAMLPPALRRYLAALALFSLGNSSDAFLLLWARDVGVPAAQVPLLWMAHNAVKAALSAPLGALSDRVGRRRVILAGWALYALVYLGFATLRSPGAAWALLLVYGLYYALLEGAEKALVADLAPAALRGRAFGWFHGVIGACALPASLLCAYLYKSDAAAGPARAFSAGAALAAAAALLLLRVPAGLTPIPTSAPAPAHG